MSHHAPHRLVPRLAAVGSAVLVLGLAACSSDPAEDDPEAGTTQTPTADAPTDGATPAEGDGGAEGDTGQAEVSAENPLVLGFEISGPAGTVIETTTTAVADGDEQPELDQTWTLAGEPKWQLFTSFVQGAVMTLKVTEGGPATIQGFRGTYEDPENPMAGYVVSEELSTVEAERGKISVLSLP